MKLDVLDVLIFFIDSQFVSKPLIISDPWKYNLTLKFLNPIRYSKFFFN